MADYLIKSEIWITSIKFTDITTINDLKTICSKVFYPSRNSATIEKLISDARKMAYSVKYSVPSDEDEKIVGVSRYGNWVDYFHEVVHNLDISNFKELDILDVGVGNAATYPASFRSIRNYLGVDISFAALEYAKKSFPNFSILENEAEDLKDVPNASFDMYLSFRTYSINENHCTKQEECCDLEV
jgi:SAM-dependent methyltransferase